MKKIFLILSAIILFGCQPIVWDTDLMYVSKVSDVGDGKTRVTVSVPGSIDILLKTTNRYYVGQFIIIGATNE